MALRRINGELEALELIRQRDDHFPVLYAGPIDENDMFEWKAAINASKETPFYSYKNGYYLIKITARSLSGNLLNIGLLTPTR